MSTHITSDNLNLSGYVPESGVFSVKRWAVFMETSEATIRRWISKYEIPFFKPGDSMFVEAKDFIRRIPYIKQDPGEDE